MYSWGGGTANWKKPGSYKYDSARAPYLDKLASAASARGGRAYAKRSSPDSKLVGTNGKVITTASENPVVFAIDVTGSMQDWPSEIFDRLPLFYQTLSQYRPDVEISFAAIGDANGDNYPLQVNNFGKGVELEDHIKALCPEGGGGGQFSESYELFGYFALKKVEMPNAKSPFLLICGDEKFYSKVEPGQVEHYIGDRLQSPLEGKAVWEGLMQRFNVFFLHKPYEGGDRPEVDREVVEYWAAAIGRQRIIELPGSDRVVDIAMGIIAKHWGQYGDFKGSMDARQTDPAVISAVHNSLRFIPDLSAASNRSVIDRPDSGGVSVPLDEMVDRP